MFAIDGLYSAFTDFFFLSSCRNGCWMFVNSNDDHICGNMQWNENIGDDKEWYLSTDSIDSAMIITTFMMMTTMMMGSMSKSMMMMILVCWFWCVCWWIECWFMTNMRIDVCRLIAFLWQWWWWYYFDEYDEFVDE